MGGFFRELATRALAPRGAVHPVSAAPYSPRAEAELPDAEVWPGAAAPAAQAGVARAPGARVSAPVPDNQESALVEDDVQFPSREPVTAPVRVAIPEIRAARERAPQPVSAPLGPSDPHAPDAPAPGRNATFAPRAPHSAAPLRPAAVAARAPVAPAALRVESRAEADTQPAPEVHIHIGRIELTAAPAQPEKSRKPATRKAMSLDEYLQHRSRRAP